MAGPTIFAGSIENKGKTVGNNRSANQALSSHLQKRWDTSTTAATDQFVQISIETEESDVITDSGGENFFAVLRACNPNGNKEITVEGPKRNSRADALKDGEVLDKVYRLEAEIGARTAALRLGKKMWSQQEIDSAGEVSVDAFLAGTSSQKQEKLIPPGEGWTRANDEMLWDVRSQVHFVQSGARKGQYLTKDSKTGKWEEVDAPHVPMDVPVAVRAGGGSAVRRGAKLERTVLLNELPKIARLALKFPLSFVDSPASAFAIFSGFRSAEAADWCAKNFHTKLIPQLASKIHKWETKELQAALKTVLQELDAELLKSSHAFSGCSAAIALLLGDRLVVSGVGQVRAVILSEGGGARQLLKCTSDCFTSGSDERKRVEEAGGFVHGGLLHRSVKYLEGLDDAQRMLGARHAFEVLQIESGGPSDEKQVRTAYKKLALRVHPDKIPEGADVEAFNKAFSRLEAAKEAVESMVAEDGASCRELHRVLRHEVHTREGAAELLGVASEATTDTQQVAEEADKSKRKQVKSLEKMQVISKDYAQAESMCSEAVETLRRPSSAEALPRQEALLRQALPTSRALGARDLRSPSAIVLMEPETMAWHIPSDKHCRLALLCGATAALTDEQLSTSTATLLRQPKAAALRWCLDAEPSASSVGAICVAFEPTQRGRRDDGPAAKKQRMAASMQQKAGCVFLRYILFRHQQLRIADPSARREGAAKSQSEAESKALETLQLLLKKPSDFVRLCRELSDCQTGAQPGQLVGQLGWVGRGEQEPGFEEVAFSLEVQEFSDIVTTSRGVQILQRMG